MSAGIRGHSGKIKVFKAGKLANIVNIVSADANQDSTFSRTGYVGNPIMEGDQTQEGWSGSMDLEVKGPEVDDLIDAMISQNLAGIGVEEVTIIMEEKYANGTKRAYVYPDCQMKMSKRQPNTTEKITKKLDWQSGPRIKLS